MRIDELVIDGFKSYPVRTTVSGWDASFNAITGLNGSGKSNILDAISFVLGITNMTAVRAANLQDLIYKRGQAGVTRASVTIIFDNADKTKAPVGFEKWDRITVTRIVAMNQPSKYLICGHKATQQQVQNLFQSVQLNINNPNFLIMQGKITKVLNMKPPEILGLIEEAAGTSMFEDKREKAVRTMDKKQKKMDEIQELLAEEINPKLEKLRYEKSNFLEFQKAEQELEWLSRTIKAYDWVHGNNRINDLHEALSTKKQEIEDGKRLQKQLRSEIDNMNKEINRLNKQREKEMAAGGKYHRLEEREKELSKEVARLKTKLDLRVNNLQEAQNAVKQQQAAVAELVAQKEKKLETSQTSNEQYQAQKTVWDKDEQALASSESLLQSLITGLSSSAENQESSGYQGQIATAKNHASEIGGKVEQAKIRIGHLQKELKEKEPRAKKAQNEGGGLVKELSAAKAELEKLESSIAAAGADEASFASLSRQRQELNQQVRRLTEQRNQLISAGGLHRLNFEYSDPAPNFDRSRVKGLVANLVDIEETNHGASTALEIAAGGRLYGVVVQDQMVGQQLLDRGRLQQRVTIIPLNKISRFVASAEKVATAKRISGNSAHLALDMVGFPEDVQAAMDFVFGSTFICPDEQTAKAVTFHKDIRLRSVTLQGDVYNPSGTLEGGSAPSSSQILIKAQQLKLATTQLAESKRELAKLEASFEQAQAEMARFRQMQESVELKRHEVAELEGRVADSSSTRIIQEVQTIKQTIEELNASISKLQKDLKSADGEVKSIEKEMNEFKNNRDSKLNELRADITKKKAKLSASKKNVQNLQREAQTATLEASQMNADIASAEDEVKEVEASVAKASEELDSTKDALESLQREHNQLEEALAEETNKISAFKEEMRALEEAIKSKEEELQQRVEDQSQFDTDVDKIAKDIKSHGHFIANLEKECPWIPDEKESFGVPGGQFDFESMRVGDERRKLEELQSRQQSQKKKINPKVLNMIENVERKEKELVKMHGQVLKDKLKIEETINKLIDHKRDALHKTWQKVNGDFGAIFGDLLPGNFCKLEPPEDMDITEGLEVKVRLGQVWKQSLTELSGGQRSLIALSLIMSLLQFKPAPMYILDEVDAALDLQHTQHIGHLFRTRFKGSQFIVVSLKEGLFTNANVLFKTRFRDGTSVVERTAQRSSSELYDGARGKRPRVSNQ